jgi:hypothetical protein
VLTSLQETWTGDTLQFSAAAAGQSLSGHLTVDDQVVHLTLHLPWFLSSLTGSIRRRLEDEGQQLLGRVEHEKPNGGKWDRWGHRFPAFDWDDQGDEICDIPAARL